MVVWFENLAILFSGIRGRFHQQFTTGVTKDCSKWKEDFQLCQEWVDKMSYSALVRKTNRFIYRFLIQPEVY